MRDKKADIKGVEKGKNININDISIDELLQLNTENEAGNLADIFTKTSHASPTRNIYNMVMEGYEELNNAAYDCEKVFSMLDDHIDGNLNAEEDFLVAEHIFDCPKCRYELEAIESLRKSLNDIKINSPAAISEKLYDAVTAELDKDTAVSKIITAGFIEPPAAVRAKFDVAYRKIAMPYVAMLRPLKNIAAVAAIFVLVITGGVYLSKVQSTPENTTTFANNTPIENDFVETANDNADGKKEVIIVDDSDGKTVTIENIAPVITAAVNKNIKKPVVRVENKKDTDNKTPQRLTPVLPKIENEIAGAIRNPENNEIAERRTVEPVTITERTAQSKSSTEIAMNNRIRTDSWGQQDSSYSDSSYGGKIDTSSYMSVLYDTKDDGRVI